MTLCFNQAASLITYSAQSYASRALDHADKLQIVNDDGQIDWLNVYGFEFQEAFYQVVKNNNLDDFLIKLLNKKEEHPNKVIICNDALFIALKILTLKEDTLTFEQMTFIYSPEFVWSIQEEEGDYFEEIRERIANGRGIIRSKKADYLLYLIIEAIIENYQKTIETYVAKHIETMALDDIKPTPEFTAQIENNKQVLFTFIKATSSLRDTLNKLEKIREVPINDSYFGELKEQVSHLITDIEFELTKLESKLNLVFSIQGHRLNNIMKTLTLLSVIFIPLTFLAGLYGMNFDYMPELKFHYGYFVLLGVMLFITLLTIVYISRKKWFD